jgi:hypothetical protein
MTRTPTKSPNDNAMWRKLRARAHPDTGGDHELFIWVQNVREYVCNGDLDQAATPLPPRPEPPSRPEPKIVHEDGRVPFPEAADFTMLTAKALVAADFDTPPLYRDLLRLLKDCEGVDCEPLLDQQRRGATYKQLAAIGHKVGMSKTQRVEWYRIAESVPLSCRHAEHILSKLKRRAA